ncbi:MAG: DUF5302 domain-containing protein [Streptosporangiaceae bacterium]
MADATAGPESPGTAPEPEPESPGDEPGPGSPEDEIRQKFRAALDRKRGHQAEHNAGQAGRGGGKVQGAHGPAQSKRSFRRKSGG